MNAILIHHDGRAEVVFGDFSGDLTAIAVLTQAAVSALEESGLSRAIQCQQDGLWITLLRRDDDSWLRVTHEVGVSVEQVREWASQLKPVKAEVVPSMPVRRTSLADAPQRGDAVVTRRCRSGLRWLATAFTESACRRRSSQWQPLQRMPFFGLPASRAGLAKAAAGCRSPGSFARIEQSIGPQHRRMT